MSQAFVKESDDNGLLHQVDPFLPALMQYLKTESKFFDIFVKESKTVNGVNLITMSNGFSYFINQDTNWEMCL